MPFTLCPTLRDAEVAQIRSYNESLRDDIEKLNSVVVAEKNLSGRQAQELARWQESVMAMRAETDQLRAEGERADVLQQANEELNNELNNVRNNVDDERMQVRSDRKRNTAGAKRWHHIFHPHK